MNGKVLMCTSISGRRILNCRDIVIVLRRLCLQIVFSVGALHSMLGAMDNRVSEEVLTHTHTL